MTIETGARWRLPRRIVIALALAILPAGAAGAASPGDYSGGHAGGSISADPDYVAAVERLRAEDYPAAIARLTKLADRLPASVEVFNYLGYAYRRIGRNAEALAHYQHALFLDPDQRHTRAELGALYIGRGQIRKAEEQLAAIDSLCFFRCREYRALEQQIEDFKRLQAARPDAGEGAVN